MSLLGIACYEAMKTPSPDYVQMCFRIWSSTGVASGLTLVFDRQAQAPLEMVKIVGVDTSNAIILDIQSNFCNLTTAEIAKYPSKNAAILIHSLATFIYPEAGTRTPLFATWFRPLTGPAFPAPQIGWSRIWLTCLSGDHTTPVFPTDALIQIELGIATNITGAQIPKTIF